MSFQLTDGRFKAFDNAGAPLVGGQLLTYVSGTTTPKVTYTDATLGTPNPTTITLNSRGESQVWLGSGAYTLVLKDALGTTIWSVDGVVDPAQTAASALTAFEASLASAPGASSVGFIQGLTGATATTVASELQSRMVTPDQFGAVGDGVAIDTTALLAMFACGLDWEIPRGKSYLFDRQLTITTSGRCLGKLIPAVSLGSTSASVVIADPGSFGKPPVIHKLTLWGSAAHQTAGVIGMFVDAPGAHLYNTLCYELGRGHVVRTYGVTLTNCSSLNCALPDSAYARDSSHEINALHISGGEYSGNLSGVTWRIGDTTWADALGHGAANGTSIQHGVVVTVDGCARFDGGSVDADNVGDFTMAPSYFETSPVNGCAVRLGTANFDGNVRNARIGGLYVSGMKWAVKCFAAVNGLDVGRNFLTGVTHSGLHTVSDLYPVRYERADATASFTQGREWHTGCTSEPLAAVTGINITDPAFGINRGAQACVQSPGEWWGGAVVRHASSVATMNASDSGRFYDAPATGKAGSVSGSIFTFTTLADCYAFNGGDRISTSPAGATYIRTVDYDAGTMVIDGGTTAAGAATVSQQPAVFQTTVYANAAPTSGSYRQGDATINNSATVGQPKGWRCTVSGTPGTWVSEGNL